MHSGPDVLQTRDQGTLGSRTSNSYSRTLGKISDIGIAGILLLWGFI